MFLALENPRRYAYFAVIEEGRGLGGGSRQYNISFSNFGPNLPPTHINSTNQKHLVDCHPLDIHAHAINFWSLASIEGIAPGFFEDSRNELQQKSSLELYFLKRLFKFSFFRIGDGQFWIDLVSEN